MSCPNCGSEKKALNEIDDSICCSQCGVVLENASLRYEPAYYGVFVPSKEPSLQEKGREKLFIDQFRIVAVYFGFPEDIVGRGEQIIKDNLYDFSNRYSQEAVICTAYLVTREWKPEWDLNDFVEFFTLPVDIVQVKRAYFIITKRYPSKLYNWEKTSEQIDYFLGRIYPEIIRQLYKGSNKEKPFTITKLAKKTKELVELGETYGLNLARKARPTITVAAILAGLCLFVETTRRKGGTTRSHLRMSCIRFIRLRLFSPLCYLSKLALLSRYAEYIDFLLVCAKNLQWIKEPKRIHVHYYLSDILDAFGQQNRNPPMMKLGPEQYSVTAFAKSKERREKMENVLLTAQEHIENGTAPQDEASMEYALYKLKSYGFNDQDIINWSPGYIRGMASSLCFREAYGSTCCYATVDLDRKEVDEVDMKDEEVQVYLR
ncbi:MAG: hypothetical protein EXX96DRAFT_577209 [Benjaminiella poitrasii]|nr:MAG: hypothetical protein EXX96DRAFT_577209 [Benjaminiella poitrasii]